MAFGQLFHAIYIHWLGNPIHWVWWCWIISDFFCVLTKEPNAVRDVPRPGQSDCHCLGLRGRCIWLPISCSLLVIIHLPAAVILKCLLSLQLRRWRSLVNIRHVGRSVFVCVCMCVCVSLACGAEGSVRPMSEWWMCVCRTWNRSTHCISSSFACVRQSVCVCVCLPESTRR